MHITYITELDYFDRDHTSGTPYWISEGLQSEDVDMHHCHIDYKRKSLPFEELAFCCKKIWFKFYKKMYLPSGYFARHGTHMAEIVNRPLTHLKTNAILTTLTPFVASYLDTSIPIVYWTDAVYAAMYYRFYDDIDYRRDVHIMTNNALHNANLLIFSSQWGARTAVEYYGISKNKIKVVPFGANIDIAHHFEDVKRMIATRSRKCIKLLLVGKKWFNKGGDIVLEVAKELNSAGYPTEVTMAGCTLDEENSLPSYVKCEGMISKKTSEGINKLKRLYQEAHFLFLPTRVEACAIVFCEACAFGVPSLTTYVGGTTEAIKDGINGMTFSLESTVKEYCDYIVNLIDNYEMYTSLALSAFHEYETRLNWKTASSKVKSLIAEII